MAFLQQGRSLRAPSALSYHSALCIFLCVDWVAAAMSVEGNRHTGGSGNLRTRRRKLYRQRRRVWLKDQGFALSYDDSTIVGESSVGSEPGYDSDFSCDYYHAVSCDSTHANSFMVHGLPQLAHAVGKSGQPYACQDFTEGILK